VRLYLVRHGRATAGWDTDPDPEIDELGKVQAATVVRRLGPLGPLSLVSSPLLRCQMTARPLADAWSVEPVVSPMVAEIPSPEGVPMGERTQWLRQAMAGTWAELGERYTRYRDGVRSYLAGLDGDTVVVSHFVAINVVIGACCDDDRIVIRRLDNGSITTVDVDGGRFELVEGGDEADTLIR
jgi:broad specificity phosphatase PhoE